LLRASRRAYRLGAALSVIGLALAVGVVVIALSTVSLRSQPGHVASLLGLRLPLPAANPAAVALLVLATLGLAVLVTLLRGAFAITRGHQRLRNGLPVVGALPGEPDVVVFASESVHAFCAGLVRPRVYLSAGALSVLGPDELRAVLAHERMHLARRDPLRIVTGRLLGEALFFAPAVRALVRRYDTLAELAADDHALAAVGGNRSVVASAMLAFDGGVAPERADHVLGLQGDWALPVALCTLTLVGAAAVAMLVWQLAHHAVLRTALVSPAPCIVVLAGVPLCALALGRVASRKF
jgi:Zn-dependent protease with chaperone function